MADQVTSGHVTNQCILTLVGSAFLTYYLYSYATMTHDERSSNMGNVFLSYLIGAGLMILIDIIDNIQMARLIGTTLDAKRWKKIRWVNRTPILSLLKLGAFPVIVCGLWITAKTIPFNSQCFQSDDACNSLRIISISVLIVSAILLFLLLVLLFNVIKYLRSDETTVTDGTGSGAGTGAGEARAGEVRAGTHVRGTDLLDRIISKYNPLSGFKSDYDSCPICLDDLPSEGPEITVLVCGHTFHSTCIRQCVQTTCPMCRRPFTLPALEP